MYIPHARLDEVFRQIKLDSVQGTCSVLILVAPTVDALCATRILVSLLQSEFVLYKLVPVLGYDDLARANELFIQDNADIQSLVLLDCGGLVDIGEFFRLGDSTSVYVIDSHRPFHLNNLYKNEQVFILDAGDIDDVMGPVRQAFLLLEQAEQNGSEDELSEGEEDREEEADQEDEAEEAEDDMDAGSQTTASDPDGDGDESGDEDRARVKRKRTPPLTHTRKRSAASKMRSRRMRLAEAKNILTDYYLGNWYGASVSSMMYMMATQLGKESRELLWLAIVGLTDQYINDRIPLRTYVSEADTYKEEVLRFCPAESITAPIAGTGPGRTSSAHVDDLLIRSEDEFRFVLFRHWSLWDSMVHSSYVANRLGLWKEEGTRRLKSLMAKMGIPLQQCQERFSSMDLQFKMNLRDKLLQVASEFNLGEICFPSFTVQAGFNPQLAAADVVYSVSALLEAGPNFDDGEWVAAHANGTTVSGSTADDATNARSELWTQNVYRAYDALDMRKPGMLHRGLELCMLQQRVMSRQVETVIKKSDITSTRSLRFAVIKDTSDVALFVHPFTICRFALFLQDAIRSSRSRPLPFLLAAASEQTDTYVIVGLGADGNGDGRRSSFGLALREAAEHSGALVKHDGFETGIIEVKRAHFQRFMDSLQVPSDGR